MELNKLVVFPSASSAESPAFSNPFFILSNMALSANALRLLAGLVVSSFLVIPDIV